MQSHRDAVGADRLDRLVHSQRSLVEGRTARGGDRVDDVRRRHRSEEAPGLTGAHLELDRQSSQLTLDLVRVVEIADRASVTGTLDRDDLLLASAAPRQCHTAGDEEVPAVAVLHLDDVAGSAKAIDL